MTDERGSDSSLDLGPLPETSTTRRIVAVAVGLAGLLGLLGLVALLPVADRLLAAVTPRPVALLIAAATILVVAALLVAAPVVRLLVTQTLDGPEDLVTDAAAVAGYFVGFLAIVIAYHGLAGVLLPAFAAFDLAGVYHLVFLVAGVGTLAALARRLYRCWRPVTDLVTAYITAAYGSPRPDASGE